MVNVFGNQVMCTACPLPCPECMNVEKTYCATTPCGCECHQRLEVATRSMLAIASRADVRSPRIMQAMKLAGPATAVQVIDMQNIILSLLRDGVREDERWCSRVKRLEGRIEFAVDALRGNAKRGE